MSKEVELELISALDIIIIFISGMIRKNIIITIIKAPKRFPWVPQRNGK